ncbi:hypothetical protein LW139_15360 [Proteus vulgaris]|uniref:hypothetical protein n=1 Tax=Proteus vulgaris TaxID=585 RepID=UPI001FFE9069|nr:hypothetical protein [Proteus vulgaris]UPK80184.1 hypothetical protein LW139_15360 [Proteus vulgaris]
MAWNKKSIKLTSKPTHLPYFKWCLAIGLSILFLIYSLSLKNKDEVTQQKEFFRIIISILPFLITIITFLYKHIVYIKNKNIYSFLYNEKKFADKKWEDWGRRSVCVIDSIFFLPQKTTISYINNNAAEHISCYHIPQNIDYLDEKKPSVYYLLKSTQPTIEKLLDKLSIKIKYLTTKDKNKIRDELYLVWRELFLNKEIPDFEIVDGLSYQHIENTIANNDDNIEIIIIDQSVKENQSAALGILIMSSDDIIKKHHIDIMANVQRPMLIAEDENYQEALNIFSEIQIDSNLATHIILDSKANSNILMALFNNDNSLNDISLDNTLDIEYFIGPIDDYSSWITMGLSVNFVYQYKKNILSLCQSENNFYINTVTTNNEQIE